MTDPRANSGKETQKAPRPERWRDALIVFLLVLASIQCVRADFFVNDTFLDWRAYAAGHVPMPYQGRAAMMPLMLWAERTPWFVHLAARYADTVRVGTLYYEPVTVEKFMSLLVGLLSMAAIMGAASWFSRRHQLRPWWLANVFVLVIMAVTVALRSTTNYWYAYDLPHAALFGIGALLALEGLWLPMLLCFAADVPLRETALYTILILAPLFVEQQRGRPGRWWKAAALFGAMALYWAAVRLAIAHRFAGNVNETYPRIGQNLHEILYPHHWPQLFSAGGYLALFVWLERRRLPQQQRVLLYGCAACVPVTLWFGVWTETRVWMEWTLPLAALAATEAADWISHFRASAVVLSKR
jgi:hypothetical protein